MGLDIGAFSKAVLIKATTEYDESFDSNGNARFVYEAPGYEGRRLDGMTPGYYRSEGEAFGFRAGSYSGYNKWREILCRGALGVLPEDVWANEDAFQEKPFVELISFSDCEGAIGPKTSAKLLKDFVGHAASAAEWFDDNEWGIGLYLQWLRAFSLAADGGFVRFR